jgi:hypothetical protein
MIANRRLSISTGFFISNRPIRYTRTLLSLLAITIIVAACGSQRYYAGPEDALETSGYYHLQDHITTYYPNGIALNFPGYIVGFEESSRKLVTSAPDDVIIDQTIFTAGHTVERLTKALRYDVPYISHIMRYEGKPYGEGNCSVYNLYHNNGTTIVKPCNDDPRNQLPDQKAYNKTFTRSWDALDLLKERIAADVESNQYTHLVVAIMGLDTAQEEAIRNYRSIISSIRKDAQSDFKPLFIGITWPSFFANRWFDPLWEALAYHPIADRADILGLSWLGALFDEVIMPHGDKIEISVIAHSFGARAATMGICVGPVILRNKGSNHQVEAIRKVNNFIGLAPAFSLSRFVEGEFLLYENVYYKDYCPTIERFIFTASSKDSAFKPVFWSDPVGNHEFMTRYCSKKHDVSVSCTATSPDGRIQGFDPSAKISYIDTSSVMRYTMPGVGSAGGGHSDIYRPEIGRFLWNAINGSVDCMSACGD